MNNMVERFSNHGETHSQGSRIWLWSSSLWRSYCHSYSTLVQGRLYGPRLHQDTAKKSALYFLHVMLVELITGRRPIKSKSPRKERLTDELLALHREFRETLISSAFTCVSTSTASNPRMRQDSGQMHMFEDNYESRKKFT